MFSKRILGILLVCSIGIGAFSGCALFELKDELEGFEATYRLSGKILGPWDKELAKIAVLFKQESPGLRIADYAIPDPEGHYTFLATEGEYLLAVFEDANQNFRYDDGELFGFADQGKPILLNPERAAAAGTHAVSKLNVELTQRSGFPHDLPVFVDISTLSGKAYIRVGVVTTLDDPLFDLENGSLGYWKPLTFLRDVGAGVYFLEKYDPKKIPVLFVHGANGTPNGWQPFVDRLDHSRYQAWFFFYPSGLRIDGIASALNTMIGSLHDNHGFKKMVVVAHSMGGLVSRAFILKNAVEDKQTYIYKFISISTPWGGVNTAAMGVEKSPVVVPNWIDVEPQSDFIKSIYAVRLPERIKFYLMFGVRGEHSRMMENNDGTIEIASELDYRAQEEAVRIFGYNEDHVSVLTSKRVLAQFQRLMQ